MNITYIFFIHVKVVSHSADHGHFIYKSLTLMLLTGENSTIFKIKYPENLNNYTNLNILLNLYKMAYISQIYQLMIPFFRFFKIILSSS